MTLCTLQRVVVRMYAHTFELESALQIAEYSPALRDDLEPVFHTNPMNSIFYLAFNSNPDRAAAWRLDNETTKQK